MLLIQSLFIGINAIENANSWEWKNPKPTVNNLLCIDVSGQYITISGENGYFATSYNSSTTWKAINSELTGNIIGTGFIGNNNTNSYAISEEGMFWNNMSEPAYVKLVGAKGVKYAKSTFDKHTGNIWVVGTGSNSLRIKDNISKQIKILPNLEDLTSIDFNNELGVVGTKSGHLYISKNSGTEWSSLGNTTKQINDVAFFNNQVFAVGNEGMLATKQDLNVSTPLETISLNIGATLHDIFVVNNSIAFIAGEQGNLFVTKNGGSQWEKVDLGSFIQDIRSISGNSEYIYGVGASGSIFSVKISNKEVNVISNAATYFTLNSIASINSFKENSKIYVAGDNRLLLTSDDKGNTWVKRQLTDASIDFDVNSVDCVNSDTAFACTDNGQFYQTKDGGNTWNLIPLEINNRSINKIVFNKNKQLNSELGIIVGDKSLIYRTLNNGRNWTLGSVSVNKNINTVDFNSTMCVAAGDKGHVIFSEDLGDTWVSISEVATLPIDITLFDFSAISVSNNNVYLGTTKGLFFIFDLVKKTYTPINLNITSKITDIKVNSFDSFGILTTEDGEMFYSNNTLNSQWTKFKEITKNSINAISMEESNLDNNIKDLWVAGYSGTILNNMLYAISNGIDDNYFASANRTKFYPNPAYDVINLEKSNIDKVEIFDINYQLISTPELVQTSENSFINISNLPTGSYLLKIFTQGNAEYLKFIKK